MAEGVQKSIETTGATGITVNTGSSNYDCKATGGLFDVVTRAHGIMIRSSVAWVDGTHQMAFKLVTTNGSTDVIPLLDAAVWFTLEGFEFTNVLIDNATGSNATVHVIIW